MNGRLHISWCRRLSFWYPPCCIDGCSSCLLLNELYCVYKYLLSNWCHQSERNQCKRVSDRCSRLWSFGLDLAISKTDCLNRFVHFKGAKNTNHLAHKGVDLCKLRALNSWMEHSQCIFPPQHSTQGSDCVCIILPSKQWQLKKSLGYQCVWKSFPVLNIFQHKKQFHNDNFCCDIIWYHTILYSKIVLWTRMRMQKLHFAVRHGNFLDIGLRITNSCSFPKPFQVL